MEEEVKQDTSETETQEKRNTEECEETAEASAENTETPEDGETSEEKDKKGFFSGRKKEKKEVGIELFADRFDRYYTKVFKIC